MKDNKIRPDRGQLWWSELTDNFFDLNFAKHFRGRELIAQGFICKLKAFTSKHYKPEEDSFRWEIGTDYLIGNCNQKGFDVKCVIDFSQTLLAIGKLSNFQITKDKDLCTFEILGLSDYLDTYNKRERLAIQRKSEIRIVGETLGLGHSTTDSTLDEFVEYVFVKRHGSPTQKISLIPNDMFEHALKSYSKLEQHKEKDIKVQDNIGLSNTRKNIYSNKTSSSQAPSDKGSDDDIDWYEVGKANMEEMERDKNNH